MKKLCLTFVLIFSFGNTSVFSCTCVFTSLSKRFKKAKAVFVGEIKSDKDIEQSKIQNYEKGLPLLEVVKLWKGVKKEYVSVDFADFPKTSDTCPMFYEFEIE